MIGLRIPKTDQHIRHDNFDDVKAYVEKEYPNVKFDELDDNVKTGMQMEYYLTSKIKIPDGDASKYVIPYSTGIEEDKK